MEKKKSLRIILVDDESIIRLDLREMLEDLGHQVVGEASDGQAAIAIAKQFNPNLIIMDIKMPNLDGLEALRQINAGRRIPTIMLTAYSQPELVERAVELGVFAYLVKPIKEADLLPTLEVALARFEELETLEKEVGNLKEALETRKLVERAKGILMDQSGLTEAIAFRKIQKLSMDRRKPIKEIAEAIILAADMNLSR
ncbi:MAG: response regulator [Cyanobacteria bacterium NC_groundwater_1444_Ag_S-0.65um_54_12]|nr:response regulator [Cyanobacteria bacterium NC_groundwater_1444_Ag_S-0.65um_54_12]